MLRPKRGSKQWLRPTKQERAKPVLHRELDELRCPLLLAPFELFLADRGVDLTDDVTAEGAEVQEERHQVDGVAHCLRIAEEDGQQRHPEQPAVRGCDAL